MIGAALELDLLTCPYVFTLEDPAMAAAGADVLVPNMGFPTMRAGRILAEIVARSTSAAELIQAMHDAR